MNDDLDDETGFWLYLIEWWETSKNEPAPPRMYQALQLAKLKAAYMQAGLELTTCH